MKLNVIVEISKNSNIKYEYNLKEKRFYVDRILFGSEKYPYNYGYIEDTLDYDGDPLDAIVISNEAFLPGSVIPTRVLGVMNMIDDGEVDSKLICVIDCDPRFKHIESFESLSPHTLSEIRNFFQNYKVLQNKTVQIEGFEDVNKAKKILSLTQNIYDKYIRSGKYDGFSMDEIKKDLEKHGPKH